MPKWLSSLLARVRPAGPSDGPDASPMPATSLDPQVAEEVDDTIRRMVAAGFAPSDEIIRAAVEQCDEAAPEVVEPYAMQALTLALQRQREAQASWPAVTDNDRLDAAFAALEARGIVARQDFTCCQSCGHGEIWDEVDGRASGLPPARGYTFYHQQDTESGVAGEGLMLAYGAVDEGAEERIGHEVVAALREHGLAPQWDGSTGRRIGLPLTWQRRR